MIRLSLGAVAALAFLLVAGGEARAADENRAAFFACDGYDPPTDRSDGVSFENNIAGILSTYARYTHRAEIAPGAGGVRSCDSALADPRVGPAHWMRKASLLRGRALHNLAAGDAAAALADLDLAEAAAPDRSELHFRRGMGNGIVLLRAYALRTLGRQKEAEALAMQAFAERPYSRQAILSALMAVGANADWSVIAALVDRFAELDPKLAATLQPTSGELADSPDLRAGLRDLASENGEMLKMLAAYLPEAEAPGRVPRYGSINLWDTEDGYVARNFKGASYLTVRMFGHRASGAIVEEMALLRAAELALKDKQPSVLVVERFDFRQSDAHTLYGMVLNTQPNGYRSDIGVLFRNPADAASADYRWRLLDAQKIIDTLGPIYLPPKRR